jgi:glutamyl-tRNA reductase
VSALREHANALVEQVLAENSERWESASPRDRARTEAIARAVANRLLHEPTVRLRNLRSARRHAVLELVRELFGLHPETDGERRAEEASANHGMIELLGAEPTGELPSAPLATVHSLQERRRR